jgi:hypothetical protein
MVYGAWCIVFDVYCTNRWDPSTDILIPYILYTDTLYHHTPQVGSIYARMRQRNLCNHRDYQNIGVNGMRVTAAMGVADSMERSSAKDHKATVFLSLIGNDVCNGHPGMGHMTTGRLLMDCTGIVVVQYAQLTRMPQSLTSTSMRGKCWRR